ncbi:MAG: selenoprotein [Halobacteriales archaeon SW_9_67_25]|jgi:selenoprotein W-related protein|nr:MAG: selenoprotein [Halobacteriales archaeon SW_9_67_25]
MTDIEIEFCVPCGLYKYATEVQDAVIEEYGERVDSIQLTTGDGGVFKIYADGDLIWNKSISDDGLDHDEILADIDEYAVPFRLFKNGERSRSDQSRGTALNNR